MIGPSRLLLARPVRKPPNSSFSTVSATRIRRSISLRSKPAMSPFLLSRLKIRAWVSLSCRPSAPKSPECGGLGNRGRGPLPLQDGSQTAFFLNGEHNYRNPIVACKGDCRPVHDPQVLAQHIAVA